MPKSAPDVGTGYHEPEQMKSQRQTLVGGTSATYINSIIRPSALVKVSG